MSEEKDGARLTGNPFDRQRPGSPAESSISIKSDMSKEEPQNFSSEERNLLQDQLPVFSSPSMKSDVSKEEPPNFSNEPVNPFDLQRPGSPAESSISMKSDMSKEEPQNFSSEERNLLQDQLPVFSSPSMKSDVSKEEPPNFSNEPVNPFDLQRPGSPAESSISMKSDMSKEEPQNFSSEPVNLLQTKRSSTYLQKASEDDPLDFEKDIRAKYPLSESWRENILAEYKPEMEVKELYSKLFDITKKKNKDKPIQDYKDLFTDSEGKPVRTVLTHGEADIGKTFHTRKFMVDWAKRESCRQFDLIVSLQFSDLNARTAKHQSMEDLMNDFFKKQPEVTSYKDMKIVFILDGLENCQLPLNFKKNEKITDIKTPASMDVLLTNLIKRNLLPNALLWIISQPSGINKIPSEYINKVTECREFDSKPRFQEAGRNKILTLATVNQKETDTELFKIKTDKEQKGKLVKLQDLFTDLKKTERTVLTRGVAGVGKTFQTKLFMLDWAKQKSNKNIDVIIPLEFSKLNAERKEQSMEDLLNTFFSDVKESNISIYDQWKVAFVLDGLEKCKLPLDFENNREVTDIKTPASMDVLLTNLIKGKLLPNALLWIISQPSGINKIPSEYIDKVTECREMLKRRQELASKLKERLSQEINKNRRKDEINHPNQKNTEHVIWEVSDAEVTEGEKREKTGAKSLLRVQDISEIFKEDKGKETRTVMTVGDADIGKSFHVQKFITKWATNKSQSSFLSWITTFWRQAKDNVEVLFPLDFSKLDLIKEKKISLVELLNHFFKETKQFVISNYEQFKIVFVLDGLNAFQHPLTFDSSEVLTDVREPASLDVLLTNLIKGNLLPSARVWITSRPSAAKQLPDDCIHRKTEIREKPDVASHRKLKSQLLEQLTFVSEGIDQQKTSSLLKEIYTDLYIIEGERGEVNAQHECRQVQGAKFKPVQEETSIKYCDIFKPTSVNKPIKTVLTIGMAGIGKTFASMKYILDWAEGNATENIYYIFPLSFRELNLRNDGEHSFEDLLHQFFPPMKASEISDYDKYKILIVLDGFDECRLDLSFTEGNSLTDVRKPTSVSVLLTNLIQGNLLPKAQVWITSRPAASNVIPPDKVDRLTEVRGFNDEQKEEYFRKRFSNKELAETILSHVKKSRSLYIMCHIPVFCWITSKVLEDFVIRKQDEGLPKTLTDMYTHFLLLQCRQANVKYGEQEKDESPESCWNMRNKETILSLGKLAFEGLQNGDLLFTEENLTDCGLDITKAAVFSGLFTQVKREDSGLYKQKLFCFVHLSIQEFLAALHVFCSFSNEGEYLFIDHTSVDSALSASDFHKKAVDKALESKHGDWDLFLRFLLGLFVETNQDLLKGLLKKTENYEKTYKETVEYIKTKIREDISDPDKNLNLFHCLNELNDHSLVKEVKKFLQSETKAFENFSPSQWSALTFVLLTSDEKLEVFDLKKYLKSEKVLLGMLPVVRVSKITLLSWCELSEESCSGLKSSVLSSASSNLTELDLSHNDLLDSGVQQLAEGLKSIHCKLEVLKLSGCQVTEKGCEFLASALKSNRVSSLKRLDLSYNHPGTNGTKVLEDIVDDTNLKLEAVCFDHSGSHRLKPGLKKYGAGLKLDENTASRRLVLLEDNSKARTVKDVKELVTPSDWETRFKRSQVFCGGEGLKGLCYWEVEWKVEWEGMVGIAVAYKGMGRNWDSSGGLGCNEKSWSLLCSKTGYTAIHGKKSVKLNIPPCQKLAVLLDWEAGKLTYYNVSSEELSLIHTFDAKFTEEVIPGFWFKRGSIKLCDL